MTEEHIKQRAADFVNNETYPIDDGGFSPSVVEEMLIAFATEATKELQEKITQLEELLAEQYPDLKQSLEWANQRENELVEENRRLKEQIEQKAKEYADSMAMYYESNHGKIPTQLEKYLRNAYVAGATENGIGWHDLRKNPQDLPNHNCMLLIHTDWQGVELTTFNVNTRLFGDNTLREVDAWCEVPNLEE